MEGDVFGAKLNMRSTDEPTIDPWDSGATCTSWILHFLVESSRGPGRSNYLKHEIGYLREIRNRKMFLECKFMPENLGLSMI